MSTHRISKWDRAATLVEPSWNAARVEELTTLWAAGESATLIGLRMGITKNQVLGKVHRLNLPRRKAGNPPTLRQNKPKPAASEAAQLVARFSPLPVPEPLLRPLVPRYAALPIPKGALPPARTCQWTDSERAPWVFCGAGCVPGYSYCAAHKARVFVRIAA